MNLDSPLDKIKGVGPKLKCAFEKAEIRRVRDLLYYLPRTYEDFSRVQSISEVRPGNLIIKARVDDIKISRRRRGLTMVEASLRDDSGALRAVWFNQPYRAKQFDDGKEYYFSGEFSFGYGRYQLVNPSAELASDYDGRADKMVPVYKASGELKSKTIAKVMESLRSYMGSVPEILPNSVMEYLKRSGSDVLSRGEALYRVHFPEDEADANIGRKRLAFEELFGLILASGLNKQENARLKGKRIPFNATEVREFVKKLPFDLTNSQRVAAWEIVQDFDSDVPMNRLLQGDVGSGKTVVAGLAAYQAAKAGFQTAVMAPTEILAFQHAETLRELLEDFGITVALLTGSVKNKKYVQKLVTDGTVDVVVGTHALISDKVEFKNLGFAVVDEQHRFGVKQRKALTDKSECMPHLLSMTATPIPRSLQLTVFGELDVSVLKELPKGRKPIETKIVSPNSVEQLYDAIKKQLDAGRQVYYVCSLIDENTENDLKSVEKEYKKLDKVFAGYKVGFLHGKMKPEEKDDVMGRFSDGEIKVLVSTTVVEVGVNVPNATVIVIADADRFGLSQLHQLRGRVGRGKHQSYCYLVTSTSAKPTRRLMEIEKSSDGFYLAEKDLELRGPGEIYGSMQHGALNLRIATITDTRLLALASGAVKDFIKSGESVVEYKELANSISKYQRLTTLN